MKKYKMVLILLVVFSIIGIGFNYSKLHSMFIVEEKEEETQNLDLGIPIEGAKVEKENITDKFSYTGTLFSRENVNIISKISAQIREITVNEGDMVKKGQVIVRLDNENIDAKLATTQAKIDTLEYNLSYLVNEEEKYKELLEGGGIPQSTYDKISHERKMLEMQLKELYAAKNEITVNLKDTILTAPIGGEVRVVNNVVGDMAMTGKPIVVIDDTSELVVKTNISESDLNRIRVGTSVSMQIRGTDEMMNGNVTRINTIINPATRIGEVEIGKIVLEKNDDFILGSSVEVEFMLNEIEEGYTIPFDAIKQLSDKQVVYKIDKDHVKEVDVITGLSIGSRVQVVEGLEEDDIVAVKNINKLYDEAKVYMFRKDEQ